MAQPLRYFSRVRLRNKLTNKYLFATDDNYEKPWSSEDQAAVDLSTDATPVETQWVILPPCAMDSFKSVGEEIAAAVEDGDPSPDNVVRLFSPTRSRHLHSHARSAPLDEESPELHEVTLFTADDGMGDGNDNWRVHVIPSKRIVAHPRVTLRHVGTGSYLASDGKEKYKGKSGGDRKMVWTQPEINDSTIWIVEADEDQLPPCIPEPLASCESSEIKIVYRNVVEAKQDLDDLKKAYEPFSGPSKNTSLNTLGNYLSKYLATLILSRDDLENVEDFENYHQKLKQFRQELKRFFIDEYIPHQTTRIFRFIQKMAKESQEEASFALMQTLNLPIPNVDGDAIAGIHKLTLYKAGSTPVSNEELEKSLADLNEQRQQWQSLVALSKGMLDTSVASTNDFLSRAKANQASAAAAFEAEMHKIRETYRGQAIAEAPGHYWKEKKERHQRFVWILAIAFAVSLGFAIDKLVWVFFTYFPAHKEDGSTAVDFFVHYTLPVAAVASLVIWGIKAIARNLISQIHMAAIANERETMLLTFRALLKEENKPLGDEEKKAIVAIIFRPGGNGLGNEGSGPTFMWEPFLKKSD